VAAAGDDDDPPEVRLDGALLRLTCTYVMSSAIIWAAIKGRQARPDRVRTVPVK
jgi:hypothetical protein